MAVNNSKPITNFRSVTCHLRSRSVSCHPTQMNAPRLNSSPTDRYSIHLTRRDERLSWPCCWLYEYISKWFTCSPTVTHPNSNHLLLSNGYQESNPRPLGRKSTVTPPSYVVLYYAQTDARHMWSQSECDRWHE